MKRIITVIVIIGIVGGIFALGRLRRDSDGQSILHVAEEVPLTVTAARPERREIVRLVQSPGDVEAVLEVEISSEIVAKIEEMPVEEGNRVKKGDLLCRLNDQNLRADVDSGEARIGRLNASIVDAEADSEHAELDYHRQIQLSEMDATSQKERQDYLTVLKKTKAMIDMRQHELKEAEAYLKRVKEDLRRTIIESPIDGIISKLNAKIGEVVITGTMNNPGTVIMTISDLSHMQVRARVHEVDVPWVKAGQKARIYLQADQQTPIPAEVVRVASKSTKQVGRDVVTFETLLNVLSHDARIRPGMTANVEIEVDRRDDAVTVPVETIVHRMRKELPEAIVKQFDALQSKLDLSDRARAAQYIKVVYIMQNDVAKVRLVEPGIADTRRVELKDGIALGDVVITGPDRSLDQLKDGSKVMMSEDEKKKLAQTPLPPANDKSLADGENAQATKTAG